MTLDQFWKWMALVDLEALNDGDDEGAVEPLIDALSEESVEQIFAFEERLAEVLHALDGRVFAGEADGSSDGFLYRRCYVVALGRKSYEAVLADPTRMPTDTESWCEPLLFVSPTAWSNVTGQDMDLWEYATRVSYETGSNRTGWT